MPAVSKLFSLWNGVNLPTEGGADDLAYVCLRLKNHKQQDPRVCLSFYTEGEHLHSFDERVTTVPGGVLYNGSVYPIEDNRPVSVVEGFLIGFGILAYIKGPRGASTGNRFVSKTYEVLIK